MFHLVFFLDDFFFFHNTGNYDSSALWISLLIKLFVWIKVCKDVHGPFGLMKSLECSLFWSE